MTETTETIRRSTADDAPPDDDDNAPPDDDDNAPPDDDDDNAPPDDDDDNALPDDDAPAAAAPLPPGPQSQREIELALDRLDREAKRHTSRIGEIMGEDSLILLPCELCEPNMAGFRMPTVAPGDPREPLYALLATGAPGDFKVATDARVCDACEGMGLVLTGSRVPDHVTKLCSACQGTGYVGATTTANNAPVPVVGAAPADTAAPGVPQLPEHDYMNRPLGHPNYGKFAQYMTADELAQDQRDGYA